jgi:ribosomal protein S18 acetylase RimI-like enzyme
MLFELANQNDIINIEKCGNESLPLSYTENDIRTMLEDAQYKIFKIRHNESFVGFIITKLNEEEQNIHIMSIAIYQSYRGKSVGSKMIDLVKKTFPEENITLYVQTTNKRAISFYKKNDFLIMNTKKDYYHNLENNDAYTMIYLI